MFENCGSFKETGFMAPSGQPDLEDLAPLPPLEAGAPQDPVAPPRRDAIVLGVGLTALRLLDGLYLNQFKRRSLIKANCSQTFLSFFVGKWVQNSFEDKFETQYHFEIQTHHSPIPFIFLKSPETDTVAIN